MTCMDYYSYRAHVRDELRSVSIGNDVLLHGGPLMQQYWVDQWLKIEGERLLWIRLNQRKIKADQYQGLADAFAANDSSNAGQHVVLPSTFSGENITNNLIAFLKCIMS
jgi:Helitron helicase-like domain at N-terminus